MPQGRQRVERLDPMPDSNPQHTRSSIEPAAAETAFWIPFENGRSGKISRVAPSVFEWSHSNGSSGKANSLREAEYALRHVDGHSMQYCFEVRAKVIIHVLGGNCEQARAKVLSEMDCASLADLQSAGIVITEISAHSLAEIDKAEFTEFLTSPISMEAVAKITNDAQKHVTEFGALPMSPEGFVRLCAAAGYTLAQGRVCAKSAKQTVPDTFDLMKAALDLVEKAMDANNPMGVCQFSRLAVEASVELSKGGI